MNDGEKNPSSPPPSRRDFFRRTGRNLAGVAAVLSTPVFGAAVGAKSAANDFDRALEIWEKASKKTLSQTDLPPEVAKDILKIQRNKFFKISSGRIEIFESGICAEAPPTRDDEIRRRDSEAMGEGILGAIFGLVAAVPITIPCAAAIGQARTSEDSPGDDMPNRRELLKNSVLVAGSAAAGAAIGHNVARQDSERASKRWNFAAKTTAGYNFGVESDAVYKILETQRKNIIEIAMGRPVDPSMTTAEAEYNHATTKGLGTGFTTGAVAGAFGVAGTHVGQMERKKDASAAQPSVPSAPSR
jgi:hypothetical protein